MKSSWRHISLWRHFSSWRHQVQGFYCFAILVFEITLLSMQRNKENFFDTCDIEQICKFRRVLVKFGFLTLLKVSSRFLLPSPIVSNSKKSHLWRHCDVIFFQNLRFWVSEDKTPLRPYTNGSKIVNFVRIDFIFFFKSLIFSRRIWIFGAHIDWSKCSKSENLHFFEVSYSMSTNTMIAVLSDFSDASVFL